MCVCVCMEWNCALYYSRLLKTWTIVFDRQWREAEWPMLMGRRGQYSSSYGSLWWLGGALKVCCRRCCFYIGASCSCWRWSRQSFWSGEEATGDEGDDKRERERVAFVERERCRCVERESCHQGGRELQLWREIAGYFPPWCCC